MELPGFDASQQAPDSGSVHFDPEVIPLRVRTCRLEQPFAIPEADLQDAWGLATEDRIQIQGLRGEIQTIPRPKLLQRVRLRRSEPTLAANEAAYPPQRLVRGFGLWRLR